MYEYIEEINNQSEIAEWKLSAFTQDLLQLKKIVEIAEKKNALWSLNGVRENLIKLANSYIDTMLNKLAEKLTNEEIAKNHKVVIGLKDYIQHPDSSIDPNVLIAFAAQNKSIIADSISETIRGAANDSWILWSIFNRLWTKDGIISGRLT